LATGAFVTGISMSLAGAVSADARFVPRRARNHPKRPEPRRRGDGSPSSGFSSSDGFSSGSGLGAGFGLGFFLGGGGSGAAVGRAMPL